MNSGFIHWINNIFVLPDGRRINPLWVLIPVFLMVGSFVRHLYQESRVRPTLAGLAIATPPSPAPVAPVPVPTPVVSAPVASASAVATPADATPLPPPAPSKIYSVRLGQGRQLDFVNRALNKLKQDELDPFYQKVGDQYWILVGKFSDEDVAQAQLDTITSSGKYKGEVILLGEAESVQRPSN